MCWNSCIVWKTCHFSPQLTMKEDTMKRKLLNRVGKIDFIGSFGLKSKFMHSERIKVEVLWSYRENWYRQEASNEGREKNEACKRTFLRTFYRSELKTKCSYNVGRPHFPGVRSSKFLTTWNRKKDFDCMHENVNITLNRFLFFLLSSTAAWQINWFFSLRSPTPDEASLSRFCFATYFGFANCRKHRVSCRTWIFFFPGNRKSLLTTRELFFNGELNGRKLFTKLFCK